MISVSPATFIYGKTKKIGKKNQQQAPLQQNNNPPLHPPHPFDTLIKLKFFELGMQIASGKAVPLCTSVVGSGQGTVKGRRRQGRQRKRLEDNIREWTGLEFAKSQRAVENRIKWRKLLVKSSMVVAFSWPAGIFFGECLTIHSLFVFFFF